VIYQPWNDGTVKDHPIIGDKSVGQLKCLFRARLSPPNFDGVLPPAERLSTIGRFAAIRPMTQLPSTTSQIARGIPRFEWTAGKEIMVIRIGSIDQAAYMVPVLPTMRVASAVERPTEVWAKATKFVLNTKVDVSTLATYY